MEELATFLYWLVAEVILLQTGRLLVWACTFGRWRSESIARQEGRVFSAAGALSFRRDGRRVITRTGLFIAGAAFCLALAGFLIARL